MDIPGGLPHVQLQPAAPGAAQPSPIHKLCGVLRSGKGHPGCCQAVLWAGEWQAQRLRPKMQRTGTPPRGVGRVCVGHFQGAA